MTLGPLMIDVAGKTLSAVETQRLRHPLVGGVILFSRNYEDKQQLRTLIAAIHDCSDRRLLVAVDQEGGRVQRFRHDFVKLPPPARFGEVYDQDRERALQLARLGGWVMAAELAEMGVDISFAPVCDLGRGISQVIGDRAFHRNPDVVARLAFSYLSGMKEAGMSAVGKHFPGHGSVMADSHLELPHDDRPWETIRTQDLVPFERLSESRLPAVMSAHVVYPQVDSLPVTFSRRWLSGILRQQLAFAGVIFSDDLNMAACHTFGSPIERMKRALDAGCDMALYCNNPEAVDQVLDGFPAYDNPASAMRLVRLHGRHTGKPLTGSDQWTRALAQIAPLEIEPELDMDT